MTRVAVVQSSPAFGAREANCDALLRQIASVEADIYVLPELALSGYVFTGIAEVAALAETVDEPRLARLHDAARTRDAVIVVGFAERAAEGLYNSAAMLAPEGVLAVYRKIHLFGDEARWFLPGTAPAPVVQWRGRALGVMICFDWFFPETARSLALRGAELICHPANLVLPFCQDAMLTRSLENRVFTATANRAGADVRDTGAQLQFTGHSQVTDIGMRRLVAGPAEGEWTGVVDVRLAAARDKRIPNTPNDVLADRRPSLYAGLGASATGEGR